MTANKDNGWDEYKKVFQKMEGQLDGIESTQREQGGHIAKMQIDLALLQQRE